MKNYFFAFRRSKIYDWGVIMFTVKRRISNMDWMVAWVENRHAPDFVVAIHGTHGVVDNERALCAYPRRAVYTGPGGGENDPMNWVESNFSCQ